jgi:hypothetical protein
VSTIGLLLAIHTAPQTPALLKGRGQSFSQSFSGRPNSGTTATSPGAVRRQMPCGVSCRVPSLRCSMTNDFPSATRWLLTAGCPCVDNPAIHTVPQAPALLKARSSTPPMLPASPQSSKPPTLLRDASPPPTHPQQANKMKMQRSAPLAQVASKTTRYEFECSHLGGSCVCARAGLLSARTDHAKLSVSLPASL